MNPARNHVTNVPCKDSCSDSSISIRGSRRPRWQTNLQFAVCVALCALKADVAKAAGDSDALPLIPRPLESRVTPGKPFRISPSTMIVCDAQSKETAARLVEALRRLTGMTLKTNGTSAAEGNIVLRLEDEKLFSRLTAW